MNWEQKTQFLRGNIKRQAVKTKKSKCFPLIALKNREFNQMYSLVDAKGIHQNVCRDFFMKCLQVTSGRIHLALKSISTNPTGAEKRGKGTNPRKTSEADKQVVRDFIESIPKYESHYGRADSQRKYLHHNLTKAKLYRKYKNEREFKNLSFVSRFIFREIFNQDFNLSFKRRHTDTCRTCDEIVTSLKSNLLTDTAKAKLRQRMLTHKDLVYKTNARFALDVKEAIESNEEVVVLTFDLQKTLETPSLTASDAFYKRQLWTYNLCIYDEVKKKGYMYMWSENIASRGGQEIGSCFVKHLENHLPTNTKKVIGYSDSCGGQNRNIKLSLMLKKFLHDLLPDSALETIEQKYFVPGHSYNSCDRCFGIIERKRKTTVDLYTPDDWVQLIKEAKTRDPKFHVTVMQENDFISSAQLEPLIINRKKNVDGDKINWFHIRNLTYHKDEPYFVDVVSNEGTKQKIDLQKKGSDIKSLTIAETPTLYPGGRAISIQKYNDLMQLLKYVPAEKHDFFNNLKTDDSDDYGFASDASED